MADEERPELVEGLVDLIVAELGIEDEEKGRITHTTSFKDINANSLDIMYLVQDIETEYGIIFPDNYEPRNIGELSDYIKEHRKK